MRKPRILEVRALKKLFMWMLELPRIKMVFERDSLSKSSGNEIWRSEDDCFKEGLGHGIVCSKTSKRAVKFKRRNCVVNSSLVEVCGREETTVHSSVDNGTQRK